MVLGTSCEGDARSGDLSGHGARLGDDVMHALVVGLRRNAVDDLKTEGDGDASSAALGMSEEAVVVAAAAAEAGTVACESEAGHEDEIEGGDFHERAVAPWLPDVHLASLEVIRVTDEAWMEFVAVDRKQARTRSTLNEGRKDAGKEIGLIFEAAEERESDARWISSKVIEKVRGDLGAGFCMRCAVEGTQALAHLLAKRGFVVHAGGGGLLCAVGML